MAGRAVAGWRAAAPARAAGAAPAGDRRPSTRDRRAPLRGLAGAAAPTDALLPPAAPHRIAPPPCSGLHVVGDAAIAMTVFTLLPFGALVVIGALPGLRAGAAWGAGVGVSRCCHCSAGRRGSGRLRAAHPGSKPWAAVPTPPARLAPPPGNTGLEPLDPRSEPRLPPCLSPPRAGARHVRPANWVRVEWKRVRWLPFMESMFWVSGGWVGWPGAG